MFECVVTLATAIMTCSNWNVPVPVLVNVERTPVGEYVAFPIRTRAYGFKNVRDHIYAVHPTWTDERDGKLYAEAQYRNRITDGCINLSERDFKKLPRRRFKLIIQ